MTEWEKGQAGCLYDANGDPEVLHKRQVCASLCHRYNLTDPADTAAQQALARQILGSVRGSVTLTPPFYCDYGSSITVGDGFYANHNCTILDAAPVTIGDRVFLGPNCVLTTASHPTDPGQRAQGLEFARPITLEDDVWLGANVTVLPGVTVGRGSVIGAGSVVTRDVPPGVVAAGSPCRVLRPLTEADRTRYPVCPQPAAAETAGPATTCGFRQVDLASWPRRDQYNYYTQKLNIAYNTTARVQVDHLLDFCRDNGYQFYPTLAYVMTRAVNQLENFRMFRTTEGALCLWEQLVPYCIFFHPDRKSFSDCRPACDADFAAFYQDAADPDRCRSCRDLPAHPDVPRNVYHLLCMPWLDFSSRRTVRANKGPSLFPLITVGRCTAENGKTTLPVNLQIAHAVCDGAHAEPFFRLLQEELDHFAG